MYKKDQCQLMLTFNTRALGYMIKITTAPRKITQNQIINQSNVKGQNKKKSSSKNDLEFIIKKIQRKNKNKNIRMKFDLKIK